MWGVGSRACRTTAVASTARARREKCVSLLTAVASTARREPCVRGGSSVREQYVVQSVYDDSGCLHCELGAESGPLTVHLGMSTYHAISGRGISQLGNLLFSHLCSSPTPPEQHLGLLLEIARLGRFPSAEVRASCLERALPKRLQWFRGGLVVKAHRRVAHSTGAT